MNRPKIGESVPPEAPDEVILSRQVDNQRALIITVGDFTSIFQASARQAALWKLPDDGFSQVLLRQGLAAACLHLANRPRDETAAWTINLLRPPTNLFLSGDARHDRIIGRVFTEGVKTTESSRLFIQSIRPRREPSESTIEVFGFDILDIFEQYYERSEQNPARFFELEENRFLMVLGLPGVDRAWLSALERDGAVSTLAQAQPLEKRAFRFECGCGPQKMLEALRGIFSGDPTALFRGDSQVEVSCPRCGRRWWVRRDQF